MKLKCLGSGSSGNCYLLTADNGETLVPRGIGELKVVLIGASAVKNLANKTQDVDCCDDDAGHGGDGQEAVEAIYVLEGTDEDGHFCNEA